MNNFTLSYLEAALWSSIDDNDQPLDKNYGIDDLAPETLAAVIEDCRKFQEQNAADLATYDGPWSAEEMGGHDFWLTRNHHGSGFWDGDWRGDVGQRLTEASGKFNEVTLYVGDDGKIYA